jgi:O-antigen ligase
MLIKYKSLPILAFVILISGQLVFSIAHGLFMDFVPISLLIYIFAIILLIIYFPHNNFIFYKKKIAFFDLAAFIFITMIVISYSFSPATFAANSKLVSTFYLILLPSLTIIFGFLSIKEKQSDKLILIAKNFSIVSIFIASSIFYFGAEVEVGVKSTIIGIDNSIWFARYVGILLLVLLLTFKVNSKYLHIISIILAIILLYQSGSRGPILGVLISVALLRLNRTVFVMILLSMFLLIIIGINSFNGVKELLLSMNDFSSLERIQHYQFVFNQLLEIPFFGYGYGSYGLMYLGSDIIFYPHNLFLEVLYEMGIFALVLIIYMIASSLKRANNLEILKGILIFMLFNSMVSGNIPGNYGLFSIMVFIRCWESIPQEYSLNRMRKPKKNKNLA